MVGTGLTWEEGGLSHVCCGLSQYSWKTTKKKRKKPRLINASKKGKFNEAGIYLLSALGDERDEAKDEWGTRSTYVGDERWATCALP